MLTKQLPTDEAIVSAFVFKICPCSSWVSGANTGIKPILSNNFKFLLFTFAFSISPPNQNQYLLLHVLLQE